MRIARIFESDKRIGLQSMSGVKGQRSDKPEHPSLDVLPRNTFLDELDNRKRFAKARKARLSNLISDMGGDVSSAQLSLLERFVNVEAWAITFEAALAEGKITGKDSEQLQVYLKAVNTLLSLGKAVGLKRRAKEVPDLGEYVREKYGTKKVSS